MFSLAVAHRVFVFAALFLSAAASALCQSARAEPRLALLMGVGDYSDTKFPTLPGIDKDLERMKTALTTAGFQVTVVENPTLGAAEEAIETFGARLKAQAGGVGLFYFSGHGGEFEGKNYLIPKGARVAGIRDIREQAVAAQRVLNRMEDAGARVNVVFLDCCRNDLTKAATDTGLAAMTAKGTFIGFATGTDKTSAASADGSPYTTFLAKRLLTPGISILDMHTKVTADVEDFTKTLGAEQTPFQYSGLRSNFAFVSEPGEKPPAEELPPRAKTEPTRNEKPVMPKPVSAAPVDQGTLQAFTRISSRNHPTRSVVDLEAVAGRNRIPLPGKVVTASLQYKDGPLTFLEDATTDANGIVQFARPPTKGQPAPLYLVFKFAGDKENRPSKHRIKIR